MPFRIDFHRTVFTLIPSSAAERHETFLIEPPEKKGNPRLFCTCSKGGYARCRHGSLLAELYANYTAGSPDKRAHERFTESDYWKLLEPVARASPLPAVSACRVRDDSVTGTALFLDAKGRTLFSYHSTGDGRRRLIERLTADTVPSRYLLMRKGAEFIYSEHEKLMRALGHPTQRQMTEESVWYLLAYHCFREGETGCRADIAVENETGDVSLAITADDFTVRISVPRPAVNGVVDALCARFPAVMRGRLAPGERNLCFGIRETAPGTVTVFPCVALGRESAVERHPVSSACIFTSLVFLAAPSLFVKMNFESLKLFATGWDKPSETSLDGLSGFLEENMHAFSIGRAEPPDAGEALDLFSNAGADDYRRIAEPDLVTAFDHVEIQPLSLHGERCIVSLCYTAGAHSIPLAKLIDAKKNKLRFCYTGDCIVDCRSPAVRSALVSSRGIGPDGTVDLSRAALLQFRGTPVSTRLRGDEKLVRTIRELLEFKPADALPPLRTYTGVLRDYQEKGAAWLLFLYRNNFGGILCDDMGLGKTHQAIALFAAIKEYAGCGGTALVVCPTTVLSHWEGLLERFAPALTFAAYHSNDRREALDSPRDVILTTYGILRNDVEALRNRRFSVALFDEAHNIKNPETAVYKAALSINANVKIGLTGTPMENSLADLKALFDLVLPGLLDSDILSDETLLDATNDAAGNRRVSYLQRLTAPFILRRLKKTVLDELPPKIEDRRICDLSENQLSLYEKAIETRGRPLVELLRAGGEPVPYMHIFKLLNHLKMICDHPALALGEPSRYESYESAKWELFRELLDESLGSGQKVVLFTQYLGMVEIFKLYLDRSGIGFVSLTGSTRNRSAPIKAFAEDERCRVFVGSLKAGGTGIDLVAGSVVLHYDRWWNASREDQATDRVHRIGQLRGVQVIKLVTKNTIEERIDSLIERKRAMAERAILEDSPDVLKYFSREELCEMLSMRR